jgi:hypothetical protein
MRARDHAVLGAAAAAAAIPVFGPYSAVFWASSVAIDADHYLDYLCRNHFTDFSVSRMFEFHRRLYAISRQANFLGLNVGHTVEFMVLVFTAAQLTDWLWLEAAAWGMLFHIATDIVYLATQKRLSRRALSVIEYAVRWDRMKKQGLEPDKPYESTLKAMSAGRGLS